MTSVSATEVVEGRVPTFVNAKSQHYSTIDALDRIVEQRKNAILANASPLEV